MLYMMTIILTEKKINRIEMTELAYLYDRSWSIYAKCLVSYCVPI